MEARLTTIPTSTLPCPQQQQIQSAPSTITIPLDKNSTSMVAAPSTLQHPGMTNSYFTSMQQAGTWQIAF